VIISRRHKKLPLRTKVVKNIEDIPAADWNKVYPDILESYNFFRAVDASNLEQFSFYYIMVYERNKPVAATTCFLTDYSLDTSINGPLRRITNSIKRVIPRIFSIRALACGMPLCPGRIGISGAEPEKVMHVVLRRIESIAKKERAPIIAFKDFNHAHTAILDPIQKAGFKKFDSLPSTELNVWYKDFEEYLKTLSAPNRYDLRRKFKKVDGRVDIRLEVVDKLDTDILDHVYRLYLNMLDKHDMGFEILPKDFFLQISKHMPRNTKFFLWTIDGKLAAFLLCLVSREELIDYYVGLDYEVALRHHLYFVKFRDVLNWCIKHGIKRYEMGITGYEPKRRLGFDFIPLYLYVKLRNRMLRPAFTFICQFLKFENFDPSLKLAKKKAKR